MADLVDDPELSAQLAELPPKALTIDGVLRRRNRELSPEEVLRFARRGVRSFALGWQFGTEVSSDQMAELLATYASHFEGMGPGHPPQAWAWMYGRRDPRTHDDTRIVVVGIGALAFGGA